MLDKLNHGYGFEQQSYAIQEEHWGSEDEYHNNHSSMKVMPTPPCLDSQLSKNKMMFHGSQTMHQQDGNWQGQKMHHQDSWQAQNMHHQDGLYGQKVYQNGWQGQDLMHQNGSQGQDRIHQNSWQGQDMMHRNGWQGSNSHYNHASGEKLMPLKGNSMLNNKMVSTEFETFPNVHVPAPIMKVQTVKYNQNKWSNDDLNRNSFGESPNLTRYGGYQKAEWISKGL